MTQLAASVDASICLDKKLIDAVTQYYNITIGLAIILAVVIFMIAGYQLVFSAGRPAIIASGKKRLVNGIIGLSIAVLSAVFLNLVNPRILNTDFQCESSKIQNISVSAVSGDPNQAYGVADEA